MSSEVKDHVTIPMKPAGVSAANALALGAAAVASGGATVAGAVVAGTVLTAVAVNQARKKVKKAVLSRQASSATRKSGGAASGAKRSGAATKVGSARKSGGAGGAPRARGLLSRLPGAKSRAARAAAAAGGKSAGKSPAAGSRSKGSGLIPRALRGKGGSGSKLGAAVSGSKMGKAAKRGGKAVSGGLKNMAKRAIGLPVTKSTDSAAKKNRARKARSWFQRNIMGKKPAPAKKGNAAEKNIKPQVNRGLTNNAVVDFVGPLAPAVMKPGSLPQYLTSNAPLGAPTHGGSMKEYSTKILEYADGLNHPGILAILDELHDNLAITLGNFAEAMQILTDKAANKWPIDEVSAAKFKLMTDCLWQAYETGKTIPDTIEEVDAQKLAELRNPSRPGAEMYDLSANGKV